MFDLIIIINVLVPTKIMTKHFKKPGYTQIQSMTKIVAN